MGGCCQPNGAASKTARDALSLPRLASSPSPTSDRTSESGFHSSSQQPHGKMNVPPPQKKNMGADQPITLRVLGGGERFARAPGTPHPKPTNPHGTAHGTRLKWTVESASCNHHGQKNTQREYFFYSYAECYLALVWGTECLRGGLKQGCNPPPHLLVLSKFALSQALFPNCYGFSIVPLQHSPCFLLCTEPSQSGIQRKM